MALFKIARVKCLYLVLLQLSTVFGQDFSIPRVTIQVFRPRGFRASIPDSPRLSLFVFQGNVNRAIENNSVGTLKGEILQPKDGRWVYEDLNVQLGVGDIINYYVYVSVNGTGYIKDGLTFEVDAVEDRESSFQPVTNNPTETVCKPTDTRVRGSRPCAGQTIFEDHFDNLRDDYWQIEQYIPLSHPEYPFVSYQRLSSNPVVAVANGYLQINAKIQQNLPGFTNESIFSGSLDLYSGCTSRAEECYRQAFGADILPPVVGGRIISTGFAFLYGTVSIRAKLPQGDWLYPELLLEPFLKKYGSSNYASGVIRIAAARGNMVYRTLPPGPVQRGNNGLYGGPIMDFDCREQFIKEKQHPSGWWGDDFHVYSVRWTPEYISLSVDGEEWWRVEPGDGLSTRIPEKCSRLPRDLLTKATKMAPFDDFFYLTLGITAGGITEFSDRSYSTYGEKPWRNSARKAMVNFWENLSTWEPTWINPKLIVDYVKVVAL